MSNPPPPPITPGGMDPQAVTIPGLGIVTVATFLERAVARIVDFVIALVVTMIVTIAVAGASIFSGKMSAADSFTIAMIMAIFGLVYEVSLTALRGQTIGKMVMKIKVVREANGHLPGWGPAFLRYSPFLVLGFIGNQVGPFLQTIVGLLQLGVFFSVFLDKTGRMQGVHDKLAKDLVLKVQP